jgi:hypothetical protein
VTHVWFRLLQITHVPVLFLLFTVDCRVPVPVILTFVERKKYDLDFLRLGKKSVAVQNKNLPG